MTIVIAGLVVLVICLLWLLVPISTGAPWVPTHRSRIRRAFQLAQVEAGQTVFDLGCGDGRALVVAADEFQARAVGIEIGPLQCAAAWLRAVLSGGKARIQIRWGNFYRADLSAADVIFAYLTSGQAKRLEAVLPRQLKAGARVVTISFDFPDWEPSDYDREDLIFVYRMPPVAGNLGTYLAQKSS